MQTKQLNIGQLCDLLSEGEVMSTLSLGHASIHTFNHTIMGIITLYAGSANDNDFAIIAKKEQIDLL